MTCSFPDPHWISIRSMIHSHLHEAPEFRVLVISKRGYGTRQLVPDAPKAARTSIYQSNAPHAVGAIHLVIYSCLIYAV
ncbi:hypothetical protein VFPPC_16526 [Pochonia chlamydosporia 170]|uniref:Uncharacterized protein n=1 Tax=Pochonia chlamydosporia 170 TaxID=1380566 RepID=A0A179F8S2_METCM|nr:hypothetical protein VFPPC_16526 [Pochonia chlamydosporia 170]OAQ61563.1 hypothetical protein VFPPC_16526 [Pochonia chlamydosporia 170]